MKNVKYLLFICAILICLWQCTNGPLIHKTSTDIYQSKREFPLPNPGIPGFNFPEKISVVDDWINKEDTASINKHAWGIWTALTMPSNNVDNDSIPILVYQTWKTRLDLMPKSASTPMLLEKRKEIRGLLHKPNQFGHGGKNSRLSLSSGDNPSLNEVLVTESYNSSSSAHIDSFKLFTKASLSNMQKNGQTDIPEFPNSSISIKPTYKVLAQVDYVNGKCAMNAWNGPSADKTGFGEDKWNNKIYIDTTNKTHEIAGNKIYNINDFIFYRLGKVQADSINSISNTSSGYYHKVKARDFVILVGMHVTTKETKRWTWQTFWWAPNSENPPAPSSIYKASYRPSQLKSAPRHYALASAYTFIFPNQPLIGGNNIGTSVIGYNPYLESNFSYPNPLRYHAVVITNGKKIFNDIGDRTNCMSCHAMSNFNPDTSSSNTIKYLGDTYVDKNDSRLKGFIKTDFLWSLADNAQ